MSKSEIKAVATVIRKFAGYYRYLMTDAGKERANGIVRCILKEAGYGHLLKEPTQ